jgi:hypothetical protein
MALRIRRGPSTDRTGVKFLEGELIYDTTLEQVFVGDSTNGVDGTSGGLPVTSFTAENAVDAVGAALVAGNATNSNITFTYDSLQDIGNRINATVSLDGGLLNVVEDLTPQLGGNLDLNTRQIAGVGSINVTGAVAATSFSGPLTGNVTGNVSGTAASVTNASQTAITQVGTLTSLGVTGTATANKFSASVGLAATVETASITSPAGGTLTITPNTTVSGTLNVIGLSTFDDVDAAGLVSVNTIDGSPLTVNINDSTVAQSRALGLLVNLRASANDFAGPSVEFRVNSTADGTDNLAQLSAIYTPDGANLSVKLWDGTGYNYKPLDLYLNGVTINQKLSIQGNALLTHAGADIVPAITTTTKDLTLYPNGNIITYGNIVPGIEDDGSIDGTPTPIPSGTFDLGADAKRFQDLYLTQSIIIGGFTPGSSKGAAGHVAGQITIDNNYLYRCVATYTNGVADIWKRVALTGGTW